MQIEYTPRGLLSACFRQYEVIVTLFLVVVLCGLIYACVAKPVFEASGSLLVKFGHDMPAEITHSQDSPSVISQDDRREIMQSNVDILQSRSLLLALIKEIGAEALYPGVTARNGDGDMAVEAATRELEKGDLVIKSDQMSNVITIKVQNHDPQLATLFALRLMEMFTKRQSDIYNRPETAFLQEQTRQAEAKLDDSQQKLREFKEENGISSIDEELSELLRQKSDAGTVSLESMDSAWDRLSDLQLQESQLLTIYRPDSPQVQHVHENVVLAKQQLQRRQSELKSRTKGATSQIDRRIAKLEALRNQYNDLKRQVEIDEKNYKNLQQRSEEERVNETLTRKHITSIVVVDEPTVPVKPVRPRKLLVIALSILAGLVLSFGGAMALETFDQRFRSPQQVTEVLGIPVMACFNSLGEGSA